MVGIFVNHKHELSRVLRGIFMNDEHTDNVGGKEGAMTEARLLLFHVKSKI